MLQLPIDILLIIPCFLSNHDLKSLRLVHSIFNDPCSRILFRSIKVNSSKLEKLASSKNNRWEEENSCSFLPYVRSMYIFGKGTHKLSLVLSDLLDSRLVNVEEIKFIRASSLDFVDYRIQYHLPATIKKLTFQRYRSIPLKPYPENLEELSVLDYCDDEPLQSLPPKMKRLCLANCSMKSLPPLPQSLLYLDVFKHCGLRTLPELPPLLHTLKCGNDWLESLPILPESIRVLELRKIDNLDITALPSNLENLTVTHSRTFAQTWPKLPPNLLSLILNDCGIVYIPQNYLPDNLRLLDVSDNRIEILPELPPNLEVLKCNYNQLLDPPKLTKYLKTVELEGNKFNEIDSESLLIESISCVTGLWN